VVGVLSVLSAGLLVLACEDQIPDFGDASLDLDSSFVPAPPTADAAVPGDSGDASDASTPDDLAPFAGIWRGVGVQGNVTWTILVDIHGGAPGALVGVMAYPSLGCGGSLRRVDEADAGTDAGALDASVDGGGATVTLRELVSEGSCTPAGDDAFTVLPNGQLAYAYRELGSSSLDAYGTLTRVGSREPSTTPPLGIWANGVPDATYLWPLIATISRTDTQGAPVGVFVRATDTPFACGGLWTLGPSTANKLTLLEVLEDGNVHCPPATTVSVSLTDDGGLTYLRPDDAGADAGLSLLPR